MKKIIKTTIKSVLYVLYYGIIALLLYFAVAGRTLTDWYDVTFGTRFREIVYTFNLGLTGADTGFMNEALQECRPDLIKATVIVLLLILADVVLFRRVGRRKVREDESKGQHDVQGETIKHEAKEEKPKYRWVRSKWGYVLRGNNPVDLHFSGEAGVSVCRSGAGSVGFCAFETCIYENIRRKIRSPILCSDSEHTKAETECYHRIYGKYGDHLCVEESGRLSESQSDAESL